MEATNISINQASNLAIIIATLKANIQSALQRANVGTLVSRFKFQVSWFKIYRQQLRVINTLAQAIEKHPTITDAAIWLMGIGIVVEAFFYA